MTFNLLADATLPNLDILFPTPFKLTQYHSIEELKQALPQQHILLCRSTLKVTADLLKNHQLNWVLTASSGRDHLDEPWLAAHDIHILDAKGSNANAVVAYVLSCLSYLMLKQHFHPQTIGIIGYGEVGRRLFQRLSTLGFQVLTYDPLHLGPNHTELHQLAHCDLICLHANLHDTPPYPSIHLLDTHFLKQRQPHQAIINAARGGIVDETALLEHHQGIYCTDVFSNEPNIYPNVVHHATLCTPHIAGHTIEAKIDAVRQLSHQLHLQLGLTPPAFPPHSKRPQTQAYNTWQEALLSHYNPMLETQALKSSKHVKETFIKLRKVHSRHEFEPY
jgi:erythronate-4-phosphate dehydrogenase